MVMRFVGIFWHLEENFGIQREIITFLCIKLGEIKPDHQEENIFSSHV